MDFSKRSLRNITNLFKLLSHEKRIAILEKLKNGPKTFSDLFNEVKFSKSESDSTFSHHLKKLQQAGLVEYDTFTGKYKLSDYGKSVISFLEQMKDLSIKNERKIIIDFDKNKVYISNLKDFLYFQLKALNLSRRESRDMSDELSELILKKFNDEEYISMDTIRLLLVYHLWRKGFIADLYKSGFILIPRSFVKSKLKECKEIVDYVLRKYFYTQLPKEVIGNLLKRGVHIIFNPLSNYIYVLDSGRIYKRGSLHEFFSSFINQLDSTFSHHLAVIHLCDVISEVLRNSEKKVDNKYVLIFLYNLITLLDHKLRTSPYISSITIDCDIDKCLDDEIMFNVVRLMLEAYVRICNNFVNIKPIICMKYSRVKALYKFAEDLYYAFKNRVPLVLSKISGALYNNAICTNILIHPHTNVKIGVLINLLNVAVTSDFDLNKLENEFDSILTTIDSLYKNISHERHLENNLMISLSGVGAIVRCISPQNDLIQYLSDVSDLVRRFIKRVYEFYGNEEVILSITSPDYEMYKTSYLMERYSTKHLKSILKYFCATSVIPYSLRIPLDKRIRMENEFSTLVPCKSFVNVNIEPPFPSQQDLLNLIRHFDEVDSLSYTITEDYTQCPQCNSILEGLKSKCDYCLSMLNITSHYGRIFGSYDNLSSIPLEARIEYYHRVRLKYLY